MTISSVNQFFVIYILFIMEIFDIINISENGKSTLIISLKDYDYGQEYCLYIENQIESDTGIKLKKPVRMKFTTE